MRNANAAAACAGQLAAGAGIYCAGNRQVALFMPNLGGGGAERVMLTLAEALVERGQRVDLVVTRATGALRGDVPEEVRLIDLHAHRIITSVPGLARYLRRERPVAVLSAMSATNCVAVWARQLSGLCTRLVLSEHSTLSVASASAATRRGRWMPNLMRWAYPKADAIVAVSRGVANDLAAQLNMPRERIGVIYNPVVTPRMLALSREPLDHPWFQADEPPVVLGVGRLVPAKDFATLLRAFAIVRAQRPTRLVILGEGEQRALLERLAGELGIANDVQMPGFVANPYQYMRAARVFALSSRWEGFGNVLAEAMACGAPVVSTDCASGPAEILEDGKWGQLVPVGQSALLAAAIRNALSTQRPRLGLTDFLQQFGARSAVARYCDVMTIGFRHGACCGTVSTQAPDHV